VTTKHISMKEMKRDQFRTAVFSWYGRSLDFLETNLRLVGAALLGVLLVALGAWALSGHLRGRASEARALLGEALLELPREEGGVPKGDAQAATEKLERLLVEHPRQPAADLGRYYLALAYAEQGKLPEARTRLEEFVSGNGRHPLRPLALLALARIQDSMGEAAAAEATYRALAGEDDPAVPADVVRMSLGELLEREGKPREAYAVYGEIPEGSPFRARAQLRLEELGAIFPPGEVPAAGETAPAAETPSEG
jgi:predicted negative regulator of RcsB-dependent stress response